MAVVEDEVRNESEEENEIEVVVEEDDGDRDSDDSEDDYDDEVLEKKVTELEQRIAQYPYNYKVHLELINTLWKLADLDRWRSAFDRLQQITAMQPENWLLRLQTEVTLAHSAEAKERIPDLFNQALLDCYSIPILTEWCTWSLSSGETDEARKHIDEVIRRAGADPLSGKLFWDAKLELEKAQLENMSEDSLDYAAQQKRVLFCLEEIVSRPLLRHGVAWQSLENEDSPDYSAQQKRVLFCLEEIVSRPLLRHGEAWQSLEEVAAAVHGQQYVGKVKKQHEVAVELLQKLTPYEDRLLTVDNLDDKFVVYQEYIDAVKEFAQDKQYSECDTDGILKVLYDRGTTECIPPPSHSMLLSYARHAHRTASRATYTRVLDACVRRAPHTHAFWTMQMQQAEHEGKPFETVKGIFEVALSKNMETYKDAEKLWLSYLEYVRRRTDFAQPDQAQRLRNTFRLAWDSLAEAWGSEANDCDVPLYWARLEYRRLRDPKQGKEIFEEIFKYGENKTLCKYWEAFISLEMGRTPPPSEAKQRDLFRRALRFVADYPPTVARMWTDYERDYGGLDDSRACYDTCETILQEWRDNYQSMKDKMTGKKQKNKQTDKKSKYDKNKKKEQEQPKNKQKRKSEDAAEATGTKRKKDSDMDVGESAKEKESGSGVKRTRDDESGEATGSKRQRTDESPVDHRSAAREACTLFVSNLEFKVDEQKLRDTLSQHGEIVSLRLKAGVKAFGGSICYCQYKNTSCVDEAVKHDRTPLDGRPMFFSRYSSNKVKANFKYSTDAEKNKLFVRNLPYSHCTKKALTELFEPYGKLKDVRAVTFKDGKPKGLAYIEYEDESSAAQAIAKCHGLTINDRALDVAVSAPPPKAGIGGGGVGGTTSLGQGAPGHAARRTQLSSFIPSVLQKPVASTSTEGRSGDAKRPLSNTDFRNLLLKK